MGTVVERMFTDAKGKERWHHAVMYHLKSPYWQIRHGGGHGEELSRHEIEKRKEARATRIVDGRDKRRRSDPGGGSRGGTGELSRRLPGLLGVFGRDGLGTGLHGVLEGGPELTRASSFGQCSIVVWVEPGKQRS